MVRWKFGKSRQKVNDFEQRILFPVRKSERELTHNAATKAMQSEWECKANGNDLCNGISLPHRCTDNLLFRQSSVYPFRIFFISRIQNMTNVHWFYRMLINWAAAAEFVFFFYIFNHFLRFASDQNKEGTSVCVCTVHWFSFSINQWYLHSAQCTLSIHRANSTHTQTHTQMVFNRNDRCPIDKVRVFLMYFSIEFDLIWINAFLHRIRYIARCQRSTNQSRMHTGTKTK